MRNNNLPTHSRAPINASSPRTKAKDTQRGFSLYFAKESGSIQFRMEDDKIIDMKLQLALRCVTRAGGTTSDALVKIHLRGQAQRCFLHDKCLPKPLARSTKYEIHHEWGIQLDHYGQWHLLFPFDIPASTLQA